MTGYHRYPSKKILLSTLLVAVVLKAIFFAIIEFPGIGPCVSAELWDRHGVNIATRYREIGDERLFRRPIKRDRLSLFRRCSIRKGFL